MFTWQCPKCARDIDIAETDCPHCSGREVAAAPPPVEQAPAPPAVEPSPGPPAQAVAPPAPVQPSRPAPAVPEVYDSGSKLPPPAAPAAPAAPAPGAFTVGPKQLMVFMGVLVLSILGAVYLAQPDLFNFGGAANLSGAPEVEATPPGAAMAGDLEVAGVRYWYDDNIKPRVRALVINHSEDTQRHVELTVELRAAEAKADSPALASFDLRLSSFLAGLASAEVETDFRVAGTLQSLPPWSELRVSAREKTEPEPPRQ